MIVKIYIGDSKCTKCGKKHSKIFEIDGKPYGSSCARDILGKDLSAPVWLYELAEKFIQEEAKRCPDYKYLGDISCNFINKYATSTENSDGSSKVWRKPIKIQGKWCKSDWQKEIDKYIGHRFPEIVGKKFKDFSDGNDYEY